MLAHRLPNPIRQPVLHGGHDLLVDSLHGRAFFRREAAGDVVYGVLPRRRPSDAYPQAENVLAP